MSCEYFNNCRLCLAELDLTQYTITEEVKALVFKICNIKLSESSHLSSFFCQQCSLQLQEIKKFQTLIKNNQEFLNKLEKEKFAKNVALVNIDGLLQIKEKDEKAKTLNDFPDKKCPICFKFFTERRKIPLHIKRIHTKIKDYHCNDCNYSAYTKFDISRHHRNIHSPQPDTDKTDRRICPHCAKYVKGNNQLTLHIKKKHLNIKKYQCDLCFFATYGKYEIRSHLLHVHIPKNFKESYACKQCPSVLSSAMGLKVHEKHKHSGIKNHSCFCGKAFSLKETLKTHIRNVHKGERKFVCDLCQKRFGQAVRLRDHFNNSHGKKQEIPCSKCNKVFHSSRNLKAHMVYHSEPQYHCSTCEKKFYLSNKLKEHNKIHDANEEHSCNICSRQFQLLSSLRRHIRSHDKNQSN